MMQPLARPRDWCVRSFEANSLLMPTLRQKEAAERAAGLEVRYVDGYLGVETSDALPRRITTFSDHPAGSMLTRFDFREIHAAPPPLRDEVVRGASFDVRQLVAEALRLGCTPEDEPFGCECRYCGGSGVYGPRLSI